VLVVAIVSVTAGTTDAGASDDGRGLIVFDTDDGAVRWSKRALQEPEFFSPPHIGRRLVITTRQPFELTQGTPAPARVVAFDKRTGERQWAVPLRTGGDVATKPMGFWGTSTVPVDAGGVVVVAGSVPEAARGLAARSGRELWRLPPDEHFKGVSTDLIFSATGGSYAGGGRLAAYDRLTGRPRWQFPTAPDESWGRTYDVFAASSDTVVVGNGPYLGRINGLRVGPTTMFVLDSENGAERSRFTINDPLEFTDYGLHRGVFVYADGPTVSALDLETGVVRWSASTTPGDGPGFVQPTHAIRVAHGQRTVFLAGVGGRGQARDTRTGAPAWPKPVDGWFQAARGRTLVTSAPDALVVRDARSGRERWRRAMEEVTGSGEGFRVDVRGGTVAVARVSEG
jgi:outer membrane protein assembly factor BamB